MSFCRRAKCAARVLIALTGPAGVGAQERAPAPAATGSLAIVLVRQLNVREAPNLEAQVVGLATRGDTLCVLGSTPDWVEVRDPIVAEGEARTHGFVSRGFVSEVRATQTTIRDAGCR